MERRQNVNWRRCRAVGAWLACAVFLTVFPAAWTAIGPAHPARAATAQSATAQSATPGTVVSLTFDDSDADQMTAAEILHRYLLHGTFYVITSAIGNPTYMTMGDLRTLAGYGDEIGDHTVSHLSMPKIPLAEARRQICDGRNILTSWGFKVTDFAYPDATYTPAVEKLVRQCGLSSARIGNGLLNGQCPDCTAAETIPPRHPDAIRTPGQIDTSWTVQDMKRAVENAENDGGGWVPIVFHHICSNPKAASCGSLSITPAHFAQFAGWLAKHQRRSARVETVRQVVGGRDLPLVHVPDASPHGVQNASLASFGKLAGVSTDTNSTGDTRGPSCWTYGGYGRNTPRWQRIPGGHDTPYAERVTMTSHQSGDAKLLQQLDLGQCSLPVTPGQAYQLSSWYTSTGRTQFAVYYRTAASGRWVYWTSSPYFQPSAEWAQARWQTPPVPPGASGVSFGLNLPAVGTLTTSGYGFEKATIPAGVLAFRIAVALAACALAVRVGYGYLRRRLRNAVPAGPAGGRPAGGGPDAGGRHPDSAQPVPGHIAGASGARDSSSSSP